MSDKLTTSFTLPVAPLVEQALIGAALIDPPTLDSALLGGVEPSDFSEPRARTAWAAVLAAFRGGQKLSLPTLVEYGADKDFVSAAMEAAAAMPGPSDELVKIVKDKSLRRGFIVSAVQAATQASGEAPLDTALETILNFASPGGRGKTTTFAQLVSEWISNQLNGGLTDGLPTGIPGLDAVSGAGGLYKDLNVIAARPAMGKTQAALQIIENVAESGGAVLFFSADTPQDQIVARQIARRVNMTGNSLRQLLRTAPHTILPRVEAARKELELLPIFYRFGPASIFDVRLEARRLAARGDLALVVVDYLQQLDVGGKADSEFARVTVASRAMKEVAGELRVPVLALSQLSRGSEVRINKRPMLADLRQSGQIEQDAALVIGLYREHYYDKSADPATAEWIVLKQKDGPVGTLQMRFKPGWGFEELGQWEEA